MSVMTRVRTSNICLFFWLNKKYSSLLWNHYYSNKNIINSAYFDNYKCYKSRTLVMTYDLGVMVNKYYIILK